MIEDGYSICLNKWVLDTQIKNELPLLLIISSLTAKTGECFASNKYFATLFDCTEVSISQKISKLTQRGYITAEYDKRGAEIKRRILRLKNFLIDDLNNFYSTDKKLFKENNISNKNTSIKKEYISEFDEFWSAYTPVKCNGRFIDKGSKKTAYDKFCKILDKGVNYEDIITGVRKYIKHCQENGQLTCGVAVFLNQERWKCDYGEVVNGNARAEYRQPDSILEEYAKIASRY